MSTYSTVRNTGLATILVASLAGAVSNGLSLDQRVVFERDLPRRSLGRRPARGGGHCLAARVVSAGNGCRATGSQSLLVNRVAAFLPSSARNNDCEPVARHFITIGRCSRSGMTIRTS